MTTPQRHALLSDTPSANARFSELLGRFSLPCTDLLGLVAVGACLSWWASVLQPHAWLAISGYILAMLGLAYYYGRAVISWLGIPHVQRGGFCLILLCGILVEGGLVYVLDSLLPWRMAWNFAIVGSLGLAVTIACPPRALHRSRPAPFYEMFALGLILASTASCTQDARPYAKVTDQAVSLYVWSDFIVFAHYSGLLALDPTLQTLGDPDYGGTALPLYHFGSFIYSAGLGYSANVPALDAVLGLWFPLSFVLLGFSAYSIAAMRWNAWSGVCAVFAVMWLPDISRWGIGLFKYSFHGLLMISPGLNYGIALISLAVIILTVPRQLSWRLYLALTCLLLLTVAYKAHLFIVGVPMLFTWWLITRDQWSRRTKWILGLSALLVMAVVLYIADTKRIGPTIWPFGYPLFEFRHSVLNSIAIEAANGNWWKQFLLQLCDMAGPLRVLLAILIVLISVYGIWLIVFPALIWWTRRTRCWSRADWIPVLVFGWFLVFSFGPPGNRTGAADEIWHRPFVWAYFMIATWSSGQLAKLFLRSGRAKVTASATICLFAATTWNNETSMQARLNVAGSTFAKTVIPTGLNECCKYIREHADAVDIVYGKEPAIFSLIGGLTERCVYVGRSEHFYHKFRTVDSTKKDIASQRIKFLQHMRAATTIAQLQEMQQQSEIRWFIASPEEDLAWPDSLLRRPVFQFDNYRVYDLRKLSSSP